MANANRRAGGRYEIVLQTRLGARSARWFEEFEQQEVPGDGVILRGFIEDQAALHGVLGRIRDLGISLVSVRMLDDDSEPDDGSPPGA